MEASKLQHHCTNPFAVVIAMLMHPWLTHDFGSHKMAARENVSKRPLSFADGVAEGRDRRREGLVPSFIGC